MSRNTLPKGFLASGVHCGIKRFNKDLGLIYSKFPCRAAGVFTRNKIKAAPILVTKEILAKSEPIHAVIINSGNANACTGRYGVRDAKRMIQALSDAMGLKYMNVCVASTGVIGRRLPVDDIVRAVPKVVKKLSEKGISSVAKAILTTDRNLKIEKSVFNIGTKEVIISGICKGAGMIHPNMATMLCFLMTDARIDKEALKLALRECADATFNSISIDGDMSTNDCALILANGQANNRTIKKGTKEFDVFFKNLKKVTFELAKSIVRDGEGATKFINVRVKGAASEKDAKIVAQTIATSLLVKTSVHGGDPNWGRIASSVGQSMVKGIRPNKTEIYLDKVCMFKKGKFTSPAKARTSRIYKKRNVEIVVNLNCGSKEAVMWTCDLSKRYVEINSHYMT